jgi:hypothetical protein
VLQVERVGRLKAGEFYVSTDGQAFVLLRSPWCLSHHPQDPLTPSEVVDRAMADRASARMEAS